MYSPNRTALVFGALLILVGLAFLLNNLGLMPRELFNVWPLLVAGAGLWILGRAAARRRGGPVVGGTLVLALGAFWLLQNYGVVNERMFGPILLIALGVGLLLRQAARGWAR